MAISEKHIILYFLEQKLAAYAKNMVDDQDKAEYWETSYRILSVLIQEIKGGHHMWLYKKKQQELSIDGDIII